MVKICRKISIRINIYDIVTYTILIFANASVLVVDESLSIGISLIKYLNKIVTSEIGLSGVLVEPV